MSPSYCPARRDPPGTRWVGGPCRRPDSLFADRGHDHDVYCDRVLARGIVPAIARRCEPGTAPVGTYRWIAERTFAWLHGFRCQRIRWECRPTSTKPSPASPAHSLPGVNITHYVKSSYTRSFCPEAGPTDGRCSNLHSASERLVLSQKPGGTRLPSAAGSGSCRSLLTFPPSVSVMEL